MADSLVDVFPDIPWTVYTDGSYHASVSASAPSLGSGCIFANALTSEVLFELHFSASMWPSAFKAEMLSFFVAVCLLPVNSACSFVTDSQALINFFDEVIFDTKPSQTYKRDHFGL